MVLFVIAVCYDLCTTFRTVLKAVCLIYKETIHAQFFKGDNIILSGLVVELVELQLNGAFALFHLLQLSRHRSYPRVRCCPPL